jgi:hypothetical protein
VAGSIRWEFATITLLGPKIDQPGASEVYKIRRRLAGNRLCVVTALQYWLDTLQ